MLLDRCERGGWLSRFEAVPDAFREMAEKAVEAWRDERPGVESDSGSRHREPVEIERYVDPIADRKRGGSSPSRWQKPHVTLREAIGRDVEQIEADWSNDAARSRRAKRVSKREARTIEREKRFLPDGIVADAFVRSVAKRNACPTIWTLEDHECRNTRWQFAQIEKRRERDVACGSWPREEPPWRATAGTGERMPARERHENDHVRMSSSKENTRCSR